MAPSQSREVVLLPAVRLSLRAYVMA